MKSGDPLDACEGLKALSPHGKKPDRSSRISKPFASISRRSKARILQQGRVPEMNVGDDLNESLNVWSVSERRRIAASFQ
jgi:hypothetical protein